MSRVTGLLLVVVLLTGASWLDPHATAREASRLYADGKFDEAVAKYREALIDDPDSALLQFNLAGAAYRAAKYDDAVAALGRIPTSDAEPARTARVAYNLGNAKYRLGAAAEASNPQQALSHYAEALVAYRRAMGADPSDEDPKFNHEFVEKKLADLKKKLEEQQQKQEEQQQKDQQQPQDQQQQKDGEEKQDQAQPEQKQEQKQDGEQQPEEQQGAQQPKDEPGDEQQAQQPQTGGEEPPAEPGEKAETPPSGAGDAVAGDEATDEMSEREAEAILDGQRDQEMRPDEMVRQLQRGRVAEPREDW